MTDLAPLTAEAATLVARCARLGLTVATAESCTGGLIAALLTEVPGSSAVVDRAFVTYSNEAKSEMIGVPAEMIARHGAVSAEVACAMASGALAASRADLAVAVTGIAGPGGGSPLKPVGLVHFAFCRRGGTPVPRVERFDPDWSRSRIRLAAVACALQGLSNLTDP